MMNLYVDNTKKTETVCWDMTTNDQTISTINSSIDYNQPAYFTNNNFSSTQIVSSYLNRDFDSTNQSFYRFSYYKFFGIFLEFF